MTPSQVMFARHGRSVISGDRRINAQAYADYLRSYEQGGIVNGLDEGLVKAATAADLIVHSTLTRSIETADELRGRGATAPRESWPELDEAPLGAPRLPAIKLTPGSWNVLARVLWMARVPLGVETSTQTRLRAARAAAHLDQVTDPAPQSSCSVLIVGHGFMNALVATELRRRGWQGPRRPSHRHGAVTAYARE